MNRIASLLIAAAALLATLPTRAGTMPWQVLGAPADGAAPSSPRQLSPEERQRLRQQVRESERERQQSRGQQSKGRR